MAREKDFDLRGKDWLTEAEAAHYCGVCLTQFAKAKFPARRFLGKKLYSRALLDESIAASPEWQPSTNAKVSGISTGVKMGNAFGDLSERLRPVRLRKFVVRQKRD